jgi:two-component system, NarL family, response regulator DevR
MHAGNSDMILSVLDRATTHPGEVSGEVPSPSQNPQNGASSLNTIRSAVRVLIVHASPLIRIGLSATLHGSKRCTIVGEAATAADALVETRRRHPDVILMNPRLPDGSGEELCHLVRAEYPDLQVVMIADTSDEVSIVRSVVAGAVGYVLESSDPQQFIEAVERAAAGQALLDPVSARGVLAWIQRRASGEPETDALPSFSAQERRIMALVAQGMTNRQIGAELYLSDQTVKGYVSALLRRLSFTRRAELAAFVARHSPEYDLPSAA